MPQYGLTQKEILTLIENYEPFLCAHCGIRHGEPKRTCCKKCEKTVELQQIINTIGLSNE